VTQIHSPTWQPPAELNTHSGKPPAVDADFFMPPPPTIGELISIGTTLKTSTRKPLPSAMRWVTIATSGSVPLLLLWAIDRPIWAVIVASIVSGLMWYFTQFLHTCSYVGTDGVVSYVMTESRSAMPNGIYTGTNYTYTWKKHSGNTHVINGSYHSEHHPPTENDPWHFANIAESVWSNYVLSTLDRELDRQGYVEFPVAMSSLQAVRIGMGFMEFVTKKEGTQRVLVADMHDISLGAGTFQFKHQDAKWWSGKGKYSFEYASIPNARVFLICLEDLAGIAWS
jgi:hypothetical protein